MFKKRLITISALPFVTALLLGSSLIISNKSEKVSAINETHEHDDWTGVTELPTSAGNYYLTDNVELSETWIVPTGTTSLCLNGHVINAICTGENNFRVIAVNEGATLNLYDCDTTTSHNGYVDSTGTHELLEGEAAKAITGGIITGGNNNSQGNGGGVQVDKGKFYLYGGNIVGNYAKNGAGVQVASATEGVIASFKMSGGTISYNKALNGG